MKDILFPSTRWKSLSPSFRPISLTSCVSKLFERIVSSTFLSESDFMFYPRQARFHRGQCTLNQILFLSQFISDGFNKSTPGSQTILTTIDFFKAFDSVWHPAIYHKPISTDLPPCLARWTPFFLIGALAWFIKITKVAPFESVEMFSKDPFLALYFSLSLSVIFLLFYLSSAVFFYADDLANLFSSPTVPAVWEATQGALIRLENLTKY